MQVDWEHAANDTERRVSPAAVDLRERTRRALLAEVAPTSVMNDWAESPTSDAVTARGRPIEGLHPLAARGIVEFINSDDRTLEHRVWLRIWKRYADIKATAALIAPAEPPHAHLARSTPTNS